MNENDNKNIQNVQPNQEIETLDAPVQQTFNQQNPQVVQNDINALNNLSNGEPINVNAQLKKNAKKTPFLIIAAVLLLCLVGGGTGVVVKTQFFDKAPNEIKPGTTTGKEDKEDKEDKDEEKPELPEEDVVYIDGVAVPEEDIEYITIGDMTIPVNKKEEENAGKTPTNYGTIEEAIKEEINYSESTQTELHRFDTYSGAAKIRFSAKDPVYVLENAGDITTISVLSDPNDINTKTEVFRRVYEAKTVTNPDGTISSTTAKPVAYKSKNYVMLQIVRDLYNGEVIILDKNMSVIFEASYIQENQPKATDGAFYFGKINCEGKKSDNKYGPVFEIYKFDTSNGVSTYQYNIDYDNQEKLCR